MVRRARTLSIVALYAIVFGCSRRGEDIVAERPVGSTSSVALSTSAASSSPRRVGHIILDLKRMQARHVTVTDVVDQLGKGGFVVGRVHEADHEGAKATVIDFDVDKVDPEKLVNVVIGQLDGLVVPLRELAVIEVALE